MDVRTTAQGLTTVAADVLVLLLTQNQKVPVDLVQAMGDDLAQALEAGDFSGEFGQEVLFYTGGRLAARKMLLFGLGDESKLNLRRLRKAAGMAARVARRSGATRLALRPPELGSIGQYAAAQMATEGVLHALYRFETFKTATRAKAQVESLTVIGEGETAGGAEHAMIVAHGVNLARGVNFLPGNRLTATDLAARAKEVCAEVGFACEVYDREDCRASGLGLLLAVNQGSSEEPRLIVMRYAGGAENGPWLGLIGKGVTFDTGGISIKGRDRMWDMKYDMSGAGAVLGAVHAIGRLKPACNVMAVIGATDNMPDGAAYKPGDVVAGLSGKTVEIHSTDAEGRLVLADCVAYAGQQGCERLVTVATLTGAVRVALGNVRYGIVSNDDQWGADLQAVGEAAGEPGWLLPNDEEYQELLRSAVADMSNSPAGGAAGTTAGGLFVMRHTGGIPCVHLDIAAQAWVQTDDRYQDGGATGVGVRTLVGAVLRFAGKGV